MRTCRLQAIVIFVKIAPFFVFLIGYIPLFAQMEYALEGRLFSKVDSSFVQASNIYTRPGHYGTISDEKGYFYIRISERDTLYISTIGFRPYLITCRELIEEDRLRIRVFLEPKVYQLNQVDIISFMTYEEFKVEVLNLPLKVEEPMDFSFESELYAQMLSAPLSGNFGVGINGALTSLSDKLSKEGKQRTKLAQIKAEAKKNDYIFSKFNPYMVQRATGMTDEDEIIQFMVFCAFSDFFLLNATQEELRKATVKKYEYYKSFVRPN
jgi:hypothetical protein